MVSLDTEMQLTKMKLLFIEPGCQKRNEINGVTIHSKSYAKRCHENVSNENIKTPETEFDV